MTQKSQLITAPQELPLTIVEVRDNMRVTITAEDSIVLRLIRVACGHAEYISERRLITQTREWCIDEWPCEPMKMPDAPLQSIVSVKYLDSNGDLQTLDPTTYQVNIKTDPGLIALGKNKTWPSIQSDVFNPITIRYTCGYGASVKVPEEIKQAMHLMIGHWFENRSDSSDTEVFEVPMASRALLRQFIPVGV